MASSTDDGKLDMYVNKNETPCLSPCTQINSKYIKDVDIRHEALKLLGECIGSTLQDTCSGKGFLNRSRAAQETGPTILKWDS